MIEVLRAIAHEPYEARGILHSEVAYIIDHCRKAGVERFIESGRARGQSTYMLAKYMPDVEVHSVEGRAYTADEEFALWRLGPLPNVNCYVGDGVHLLPLLAAMDTRPTAVFCDGPKGTKAVSVVRECFSLPQVVVGFIHDMRRLDHSLESPYRKCAIEHFAFHSFSDDPRYVEEASWMDANIVSPEPVCGPEFEKVHGSYGPTVGVFHNPIAINQSMKGD